MCDIWPNYGSEGFRSRRSARGGCRDAGRSVGIWILTGSLDNIGVTKSVASFFLLRQQKEKQHLRQHGEDQRFSPITPPRCNKGSSRFHMAFWFFWACIFVVSWLFLQLFSMCRLSSCDFIKPQIYCCRPFVGFQSSVAFFWIPFRMQSGFWRPFSMFASEWKDATALCQICKKSIRATFRPTRTVFLMLFPFIWFRRSHRVRSFNFRWIGDCISFMMWCWDVRYVIRCECGKT